MHALPKTVFPVQVHHMTWVFQVMQLIHTESPVSKDYPTADAELRQKPAQLEILLQRRQQHSVRSISFLEVGVLLHSTVPQFPKQQLLGTFLS